MRLSNIWSTRNHTAGNAALAALGATVIGQENIYPRLQALTPENLPTLTYNQSITCILREEGLDLLAPVSPYRSRHHDLSEKCQYPVCG